MFNKRLITALVLGGLMFLLVASGSALAAKGGGGGHHGGGGGTTTPTVVCSEAPNPLPVFTYGTITGWGLAPNSGYGYVINGSVMGFFGTDASGNFSISTFGNGSGTFTLSIGSWGGPGCTWQVV
jgi:hypothetical protein